MNEIILLSRTAKNKINRICDYGCDKVAKYEFKNGKWCCSKYSASCSEMKKLNKPTKENLLKRKQRYKSFIEVENINNDIFCDYGCGNLAKYSLNVVNKKFCCSKYYSQCPNIKNKNSVGNIGKKQPRGKNSKLYGRKRPDQSEFMKINNPMFVKKYRDKVIKITKSKEYRDNMALTIKNMWKDNPELKKQVSESSRLRWKDDNYRKNHYDIMVAKGYFVPDENLKDIELYYRQVKRYTVYSLANFYHLINPNNEKIGKNFYSIDHKYSKIKGYRNKIKPEIIGSVPNLHTIPFSLNSSKKSKCIVTKKDLIKRFKNFNKLLEKGNII